MLRSHCLGFVVLTPILLALAGCGGQRQWEVTVENKGDVPCSFFVTFGPAGTANATVEDVAKGKKRTLIVGPANTMVHTVKVVREKDEQLLTPNTELPVGKRYTITVSDDGKVETAVSDR